MLMHFLLKQKHEKHKTPDRSVSPFNIVLVSFARFDRSHGQEQSRDESEKAEKQNLLGAHMINNEEKLFRFV